MDSQKTKRVGDAEWLAKRQIVFQPNSVGVPAYQHIPSGVVLPRKPEMSTNEWEQAKIEFGRKAERGELQGVNQ